MTNRAVNSREEIELIDFLRVLWKRKYLILVGTLLFSLITGVVSYQMTKIYRIDMVVRPGVLKISAGEKNKYIDSPENIKALIEAGTFDEEIIKSHNNKGDDDLPKTIDLKIDLPRNSNMLKISYDTPDIQQGLNILSSLGSHLLTKYDELVKYYISEYDKEINIKQADIDSNTAKVQASKQLIKHLEKRIAELNSEIELINNNTLLLMRERDKMISNKNQDDILSAILYTNTIQQNLTLANTYKNQINDYNSAKENEKVRLENAKSIIKTLSEEIKHIEFKKNNVQNIQILQPPTSSPRPIKPRTKFSVVIAFVVGVLVMTFVAVFFEYLSKHKTGSVR